MRTIYGQPGDCSITFATEIAFLKGFERLYRKLSSYAIVLVSKYKFPMPYIKS